MPQVQVHVVLPGLPQRAVHLHGGASAADRRLRRRGLGQRRFQPAAIEVAGSSSRAAAA